MHAHDFFLNLLIILLTARVFAELATRLKSPAVIGELFAGVVLGPSLLGWIEPTEAIRLMAGIGIILLLFEVGLETDVKRLVSTGLESVVVALAGFILPLLLGFALAYWLFDLSLLVSLFIGGTLTATSIGITVRVLGDLKRQHSKEGQIVLGAAMIPRGEVGLIFSELGRESGIFSNEIYAGMEWLIGFAYPVILGLVAAVVVWRTVRAYKNLRRKSNRKEKSSDGRP